MCVPWYTVLYVCSLIYCALCSVVCCALCMCVPVFSQMLCLFCVIHVCELKETILVSLFKQSKFKKKNDIKYNTLN